MTSTIQTDYLVIGSGATAMAFTDTLLAETEATITLVDRRHVPGGHWNDAYPFVRLHQPSQFYGVASRPLGRERIDRSGFNQGFFELATGVEVTRYFHAVMDEIFLPSGRVRYLPMSNHDGDGVVTSMLSGERTEIEVGTRLVDATLLETSIPLTHRPRFEVADGVVCEPPNHLPRLAARHRRITVLGGGKTAFDVITWLLSHGYDPDRVRWIVPRDSWVINRSQLQPGIDFFPTTFASITTQYELCAEAATAEELWHRFEEAGIWMRLDPDIEPSMFHAATLSEAELHQMRRIGDVVRAGRVVRIEPGRLVLTEAELAAEPDTLYVDCTASAVATNVGHREPVFAGDRIALQMLRPFQPCFSMALIAHLEAAYDDDGARNAVAEPTPMTDTPGDWLRVQASGMRNQAAWSTDGELSSWIAGCRLDAFGDTIRRALIVHEGTEELLARVFAASAPGVANLERLAADG